jgi:hypothetical protein
MLSRLNPISVVRFLVFAEIGTMLFAGWSRPFDKWDELNSALERSGRVETGYVNTMLKSLQANADEPAFSDRVTPYNRKAISVYQHTSQMLNYIESLKHYISKANIDHNINLVIPIDSLSILSLNLSKFMLNEINPYDSAIISELLPLKNWLRYRKEVASEKSPMKKNIAILSAIQNDAINSEDIIIRHIIMDGSSCGGCGGDDINAIAIPDQSHLLLGDKLNARIGMVALNYWEKPKIVMTTGKIERIENGIASWKSYSGFKGWHTVSGTATIRLNYTDVTKPWSFKYFVGEPYIQLYVKDQNFIYAGIPSPVTVEGHGYAIEDMDLLVPGAEVKPISPGHFEVLISGPHKAAITAKLLAKDKTGKMVAVDAIELSIIDLPLPVAGFGTNTGGPISVNYLLQHDSLTAQLRDDDISAIRPVITQYEISYFSKENPEEVDSYIIKGKSLGYQPTIKQVLLTAKKGDRITINGIKCRCLDGRLFSLDPCSYIIE